MRLYQYLLEIQKKDLTSFHVPGHKNGALFNNVLFQEMGKLDLTELSITDDLHQPSGIIKETQDAIARLYVSKASFLCVNGSTAGNLAMLYTLLDINDIVLVQRNCHKSIFNGLKLIRAKVVFIDVVFTDEIPLGVCLDDFRKKLALYPNAKVVILTYPNYQGYAQNNMETIISIAKQNNLLVGVDEAHGAHFLLEGCPKSTLEMGADIVVHSAHKSLPTYTQGSLIHIGTDSVEKSKLQYYLSVFQTSSPSFLLMASIDYGVQYLEKIMSEKPALDAIYNEINQLKVSFREITGLSVPIDTKEFTIDPFKLNICAKKYPFSPKNILNLEASGFFFEMTNKERIVGTLPISLMIDTKFVGEFKNMLFENKEIVFPERIIESHATSFLIDYSQLNGSKIKSVSFEEAIGKKSAKSIIPYPPGVPVLIEGENITKNHLNCIRTGLNDGVYFQADEEIKQDRISVYID